MAPKKSISDVLAGYSTEEIASLVASKPDLLLKVSDKAEEIKNKKIENQRLELLGEITMKIDDVKSLIVQYLPLEKESGALKDQIKRTFEGIGLFTRKSVSGSHRGQYKQHIASIFSNKDELSKLTFIKEMSVKTGKTELQLTQRYAAKPNRERDGIVFNGDIVTKKV